VTTTTTTSDALVLPIIHAGVMGESGAGKSYFIATGPKPMLVVHLDAYGKDQAYLDVGNVDQTRYAGEYQQPITLVMSRKTPGAVLVQLEYFHDNEPTQPQAFDQLWRRWPSLRQEVIEGRWRSVVLETFSTLDLYARYRRTHGPLAVDKPNILATDDVEQMLSRFNSLPCNLFMAAHIDKDMQTIDGKSMRVARGPGRLAKGFTEQFASEMYRVYGVDDGKGGITPQLQTRNDGTFNCATRIGAPNPCYPAYRELFVNYIAKQQAAQAAAQGVKS
jgi:hypothetical protein